MVPFGFDEGGFVGFGNFCGHGIFEKEGKKRDLVRDRTNELRFEFKNQQPGSQIYKVIINPFSTPGPSTKYGQLSNNGSGKSCTMATKPTHKQEDIREDEIAKSSLEQAHHTEPLDRK